MPVRAYFCKLSPSSPADWFKIHNGLLRSSRQTASYYKKAMAFVFHQIPVVYRRIRGPAVFGDIVLTDYDPSRWDSRVDNCIRWITSLQPVIPKLTLSKYSSEVQIACALYGAAEGSAGLLDWLNLGNDTEKYRSHVTSGFLTPRQSIRRWKVKLVPYS
jgi:hypothetical protein